MKNTLNILLLILMLMFAGCKTELVKKEIYLIPANFIGDVVLIYNQPDGVKDSIVNDAAIYKIPKNGILYLVGHQHLQEFKDMKYYYYANNKIIKKTDM